MNAKQTIPALVKLAPVLVAAGPPVIIGAAIGGVILWLLSRGNNPVVAELSKAAPEIPQPAPIASPALAPAAPSNPHPQAKRVRREDVAEALAYGARWMTRGEAVAALQKIGFGKTAAYKALSLDSRFAPLIGKSPDGLLEWQG